MKRRFGMGLSKREEPKKVPPPAKNVVKKLAAKKKPFKPRGMRLAWSWSYRGFAFVTENNSRTNTAKLYTLDVNTGERTYHLTAPIKDIKKASNELVKIFIAENEIAKLAGSHINQAEQIPEQGEKGNGGEGKSYHAAETDD